MDYRTHDVVDEVRRISGEQRPIDLALDAIGGRSFKQSFSLAADAGLGRALAPPRCRGAAGAPPPRWPPDASLQPAQADARVEVRDSKTDQSGAGSRANCRFDKAKLGHLGREHRRRCPDAVTVVKNWINEVGAPAGETGHREAIFAEDLTLMGTGFAAGGTAYKNYWTQDFVGLASPGTRPRLTDGIHIRASGTGGSLTFGTTYYDAGASQMPTVVNVVIYGACTELPLVRGTPDLGAFEKAITLDSDCHGYYFVAQSGASTFLYPDTGGLQVGVGSGASSCPLFSATVMAGSSVRPVRRQRRRRGGQQRNGRQQRRRGLQWRRWLCRHRRQRRRGRHDRRRGQRPGGPPPGDDNRPAAAASSRAPDGAGSRCSPSPPSPS